MNARKYRTNASADLDRLCKEFGIPPAPTPPPPKPYSPAPGIDCYCCDFRRLPVARGSVTAVVTDIPYDTPWLPNVEEFAEWCAWALRPGGIMATWYGQAHLDRCMTELGKHLRYRWQFVAPLLGSNSVRGFDLHSRYQLVLVYGRPGTLRRRVTDDWIPAGRRERGMHPYRKNAAQMQYLVEAFSEEQDVICDPCAGSFTVAKACWHANRRFVGGDIDARCLDMARRRFASLPTHS
jgi:hypothetical protein